MEIPIDIKSLSIEDVHEEYLKLFERYQLLREYSEEDSQRIHDLKRNLDLSEKAQAYLAQELEQYTTALTAAEASGNHKIQEEIAVVQSEKNVIKLEYDSLQREYDSLLEANEALINELKVEKIRQKQNEPVVETTIDSERINDLERENMDLMQKLEEYQGNGVRHTIAMAEREKNIEILRDQLNCLEENMRFKREELEETTQLLESTQEQLAEANGKLAMLTSGPENNDRKGNSLFAEVDDQRQAMRQLLAAQKKSYLQMKKTFNDSDHEIRRLKRENIAMHTELQACSSIFCNADRTYQNKLTERIHHLLNQNETLERKLHWSEERLKEIADEKGVLWLDSMLNFCKQETDELKKLLHSVRIQKASLEEQLRNSQQEMARWRFESLKSRCVLLDRENLLTENKIPFKVINSSELKITAKQVETARPLIVSAPIGDVVESISCNECDTINARQIGEKTPKRVETPDNSVLNSSIETSEQSTSNYTNDKENTSQAHCKSELVCEDFKVAENRRTHIPLKENTQKNEVIADGHLPTTSKLKKSPPHASALPGPSILCKDRAIFAKEDQKSVQFSTKKPAVHDISTDGNISIVNELKNTATPAKPLRNKSKLIVRRLVIGAKQV